MAIPNHPDLVLTPFKPENGVFNLKAIDQSAPDVLLQCRIPERAPVIGARPDPHQIFYATHRGAVANAGLTDQMMSAVVLTKIWLQLFIGLQWIFVEFCFKNQRHPEDINWGDLGRQLAMGCMGIPKVFGVPTPTDDDNSPSLRRIVININGRPQKMLLIHPWNVAKHVLLKEASTGEAFASYMQKLPKDSSPILKSYERLSQAHRHFYAQAKEDIKRMLENQSFYAVHYPDNAYGTYVTIAVTIGFGGLKMCVQPPDAPEIAGRVAYPLEKPMTWPPLSPSVVLLPLKATPSPPHIDLRTKLRTARCRSCKSSIISPSSANSSSSSSATSPQSPMKPGSIAFILNPAVDDEGL
ncbi:hypothetical protein DFP72DRAFT_1082255 [Ephemerocybe angulata]|uniref:Uncharacterized protein n=1 Tax=Ephemerocybe angulata TaxID=980116 RepID=A0A8H6H9W6_9AGAR|nr:hypothetical protein DFP72DRAFT_1082255 [Tulosesus angulatus]